MIRGWFMHVLLAVSLNRSGAGADALEVAQQRCIEGLGLVDVGKMSSVRYDVQYRPRNATLKIAHRVGQGTILRANDERHRCVNRRDVVEVVQAQQRLCAADETLC